MSKRLLIAAAVAALALPSSVAASGSTAYADAAGDTSGPDITTVAVSNDDAGLITFAVFIPNRPGLASGMLVVLLLNTDGNSATGNTKDDGADYALEYDNGAPLLGKWDGVGSWDWTVPHTSLTSTYLGGVTLKVSATELGGTTRFSFYAVAGQTAADGSMQSDFAPDVELDDWSYSVQVTPPAAKPAPKAKPKRRKKKP